VKNCNIAYDIVCQHTMSYMRIRHRMSAYDIVYQHTISYVNIRCRTSTYDVVYDMAMHWTLSNDGRCGGGGDLTKQSEHAFLARILEASDARSFVTLDVLEGLKQNEFTWTDSTRDQRAVRSARAGGARARGPRCRRRAEPPREGDERAAHERRSSPPEPETGRSLRAWLQRWGTQGRSWDSLA
jgi:hypothetical protein